MINCLEILEEQIDLNPDRYKSVLRIPAITKQGLVSDIQSIITLVNSKELTHNQLVQHMCATYGMAENTAVNICPTLERANILMKRKDKFVKPTNVGLKYLENKRTEYLGKGFLENHFGFLEVLLLLLQKRVKKKNNILQPWINLYESEYGKRSDVTHNSQFLNIFKYLSELDYIKKDCSVNEPKIISTFEIEVF